MSTSSGKDLQVESLRLHEWSICLERVRLADVIKPNLQAILDFEEEQLQFDETGRSQPVRMMVSLRNRAETLVECICIIIDHPSSMKMEVEEALEGTYMSVYDAKVGAKDYFRRIVLKNDEQVFHPIGMDWTVASMRVSFAKSDPEGIVWTALYAKSFPEALGATHYAIKGDRLDVEPLERPQEELRRAREELPYGRFIARRADEIKSGILRKAPEKA